MWNMKCVTPANARATGIVPKGLKNVWIQYQKAFNRFPTKKKAAIVGTSHIIRKVLQSETWSLSGEEKYQGKGNL
jgi:hypothetical protein